MGLQIGFRKTILGYLLKYTKLIALKLLNYSIVYLEFIVLLYLHKMIITMETKDYTIKKYKSAMILSIVSFMGVMLINAIPRNYAVYFAFFAAPVMLYFMFRHYQVIKQEKTQKDFMVFILAAVIIQLGLTFAFFT
jgi:hypothetical protein